MAALENIVTIGNPADPVIIFRNASDNFQITDGIKSIGGIFSVSVSGDELAIDTVTMVVQYGAPGLPQIPGDRQVYLGPGNELYVGPNNEVYYYQLPPTGVDPSTLPQPIDLETAITYGMPLLWECDGRVIADFFVKSVTQIARYQWKIEAISGVGLLDKQQHVGGIYTGQAFAAVATEIINGAFPFTVADALATQEVYNWLPYDTARNNLHRLLVALGASIRRDDNGEVRFVFLSSSTGTAVDDERISVRGSVTKGEPVTRYEVTEHAYYADASAEAETLYDNTQSGTVASHTLVKFNEPIQAATLTTTGTLSIDGSGAQCGVNYAYVSGAGTLTGKPYAHYSRTVSADAGVAGEVENVKSLRDDFTLISIANSNNVATRLLEYFRTARKVRAQIKLDGERCGDVLRMKDPFFKAITAFAQSMDVNASTNLLATATLIDGYTPSHQGNSASGNVTLTGSGTWTSPFTGTLTVIVCGGGKGGSAGSAGEDAPTPTVSSYNASGAETVKARYIMARNAKAGAGGAAGAPGTGGKVYVATMQVTQGQVISFACGVGGAGEVYGGATAQAGTDTTFGGISSASGSSTSTGYIDPINGDRLGATGEAGIAGGNGVGWEIDGETDELRLVIPEPIDVNGTLYSAGSQGTLVSIPTTQSQTTGRYAADIPGGFGGGAAYGSNGDNGNSGSAALIRNENNYIVGIEATAAAGGDGADAIQPPQASGIGRGGTGGNGGGGAGAVGAGSRGQADYDAYLNATCWAENRYSSSEHVGTVTLTAPTPASGGAGSNGGKGGDGAVRLYWGG